MIYLRSTWNAEMAPPMNGQTQQLMTKDPSISQSLRPESSRISIYKLGKIETFLGCPKSRDQFETVTLPDIALTNDM